MKRPRPLDQLFADLPDGEDERRLLLGLACMVLATRAFRRGAAILDRLPTSRFCDSSSNREPAKRAVLLDRNMALDVAETLDALTYFASALATTTGQRPPRELVLALHARRPVRKPEGGAEGIPQSRLGERARRTMRLTWPIHLGMHWIEAAVKCLHAYVRGQDSPLPVARVAPVSLDRISGAVDSTLLRADCTGGDLTPFFAWADIGQADNPEESAPKRANTDEPAAIVAEVVEPRPVRFREFF